jgi:hypothetical protein
LNVDGTNMILILFSHWMLTEQDRLSILT